MPTSKGGCPLESTRLMSPPDGPAHGHFSTAQVARLTGASSDQLRRWDRSGLLPAARTGKGRRYSFGDVIAARTAIDLRRQGLTTRQVREAVEAVRAWEPEVNQPLAALRVFADGAKVVVKLEESLVEADSGQLLLDLPVGPLAEAADALRGEVVEDVAWQPTPQDAEAWVSAGVDADAKPDGLARAEACYRRALELDPEHPGALLNLGNVEYDRGATELACGLYRRATESAPGYPDAWYNLGNALDDLGRLDAAATAYETALDLAPAFADAHFNLALLWEKAGQRRRARPHWQRYVMLLPDSDSAQMAWRFIEDDTDLDP